MIQNIDIEKEVIRAIVNICRRKEYFGHVVQQFQKVFVSPPHQTKTLSVGRMPGEQFIKMYINRAFVEYLFSKYGQENAWNYLIGIGEHEILHCCFGHLSLFLPDRNRSAVAKDCAVNSFLDEKSLPPEAIRARRYGLPEKKSAVWYYNNLLNNQQYEKDVKDGLFDEDSHSMWDDLMNDPLAKEFVKDILRKAKDNAGGYGNLSSDIIEQLDSFTGREKPIIPWTHVLRMFCASAQDSTLGYTMSRESKRFGVRPGTKKEDSLNLAVVLDTSGSMSKDQIEVFFNEIRWIWRNGANVTIYESDLRVCRRYVFKGKFDGEIHGRGGTDLEPALQEVEGKYDACIYFTDFQAPKIERRYRIPVLWVLTNNMDPQWYPCDWGRRIHVDTVAKEMIAA